MIEKPEYIWTVVKNWGHLMLFCMVGARSAKIMRKLEINDAEVLAVILLRQNRIKYCAVVHVKTTRGFLVSRNWFGYYFFLKCFRPNGIAYCTVISGIITTVLLLLFIVLLFPSMTQHKILLFNLIFSNKVTLSE